MKDSTGLYLIGLFTSMLLNMALGTTGTFLLINLLTLPAVFVIMVSTATNNNG